MRAPFMILVFNTAVLLFTALFYLPLVDLPRPPWMEVLATLALWWCLIGMPLSTAVVGVLLMRRAVGVVLGLVWAASLLLLWAGALAFGVFGEESPFGTDLAGSYRFESGDRLVLRPAREGEGSVITASPEEAAKIYEHLRRARGISGDGGGGGGEVSARAAFERDGREMLSFGVTRDGEIIVDGKPYAGTEWLAERAGQAAGVGEQGGGGGE